MQAFVRIRFAVASRVAWRPTSGIDAPRGGSRTDPAVSATSRAFVLEVTSCIDIKDDQPDGKPERLGEALRRGCGPGLPRRPGGRVKLQQIH